jgi:hypothetical protein
MPITTIRQFPSRNAGLTQDAYSSAVENSLTDTKKAIDDINANASQYNVATSTTSSSSVLIGTGAKTFTVPAALGFVVGMTLRIANTSSNFMTGEVTSYTSTTLVMNITSVGGSGTFASWSISMAAVGASTAATISNAPAGNIASTTVQAAINELDSEKLSNAAGAVTGTNLENITTAQTVGSTFQIPVITTDENGRVTVLTVAQKINFSTFTSTASGTAFLFSGVNASVRKITMGFVGVSTATAANMLIQIGTGGSLVVTGYVSASSRITSAVSTNNNTTGFHINTSVATESLSGSVQLTNISGNTWVVSGVLGDAGALTITTGGFITLGGPLDRINLTSVGGVAFDGGGINIALE